MDRIGIRLACLGLCFFVGGCERRRELPAAPGAKFDPIAYFAGRAEGRGRLKKLFGSPVGVAVQSAGRIKGGVLIIDQAIGQGTKPTRMRRWRMEQVGPGRYTGTLTDAAGPVRVTVSGPRARIRYTMNNGLHIDQQLALQSDGKTLLNRLYVTKLGVRVAVLNETIRKLG